MDNAIISATATVIIEKRENATGTGTVTSNSQPVMR